jgi:hypothetical protein
MDFVREWKLLEQRIIQTFGKEALKYEYNEQNVEC